MNITLMILLLSALYILLVMFGGWSYKRARKRRPFGWEPLNKALNLIRFFFYTLVLPAGVIGGLGLIVAYLCYIYLY